MDRRISLGLAAGIFVLGTSLGIGLRLAASAEEAKEKEHSEVKPGSEHALLKRLEGDWEAETSVSFEPGAPPLKSKGSETSRMGAGGTWLISDYKGELAGSPFEGHGITGWDPEKKKYVMTWVNNMTTNLTVSEGTYDEKSKTLTFKSKMKGPAGDMVDYTLKTVFKDNDQHIFTMSMPGPDGKDMQFFKSEYKRKKK